MPFPAKSCAPSAVDAVWRQPVLDRAAESGIVLFTAPAGYVLTASLSAALAEYRRAALWLRLDVEDSDPASLLVSLIDSAQRLSPGAGLTTLEHMRRQPGPVAGWPQLFEQLGQEFSEALPDASTMVLEHVHNLAFATPTLALLTGHLLPALRAGIGVILTSRYELPQPALPGRAVHLTMGDLRLDERSALAYADRAGAGLPAACVRRAVALTQGSPVALSGLLSAAATLGSASARRAIDRAVSMDVLLAHIVRAWLTLADARVAQRLALAVRLEYFHPLIARAVWGESATLACPWVQALDDDWTRVYAMWQGPLAAALSARSAPDRHALHRAASYLADQGAVERAVSLYVELGDTARAAQAIDRIAGTLINRGQWQTLEGWLEQLPAMTLHARPRLVFTTGEIAAGQGHVDVARRSFAAASKLFAARGDTEGESQSLLAESAVAACQGDCARARSLAHAAYTAAKAAGFKRLQVWADWQAGRLASAGGNFEEAYAHFSRAATLATDLDDAFMLRLTRRTRALMLEQYNLRRWREFHRQAYYATDQTEHDSSEHLRAVLEHPASVLDGPPLAHAWSDIPLILKLPPPAWHEPGLPDSDRKSLWHRFLGMLGLRGSSVPRDSVVLHRPARFPSQSAQPAAVELLAVTGDALAAPLPDLAEAGPFPTALGPAQSPSRPSLPGAAPDSAGFDEVDRTRSSPSVAEARPTITAYLLGTFRVFVNDQVVASWPSHRSRALFKYLLANRSQPVVRDVLMDTFWPDASPKSARNSLNVAVYGLRRALKAATGVPLIVLQDGAYSVDPDLPVWLDADEFDRRVRAGRQLEEASQVASAAAEYEAAINLYQGDYLTDDPYLEWPVLTRERLRLAYLDTLDRLSRIYFNQHQYARCASVCQLLLARDNCREDAHCLLMRCFGRQNQYPLALRQYQACVEVLRAELDVLPAASTTLLYERIRRREPV